MLHLFPNVRYSNLIENIVDLKRKEVYSECLTKPCCYNLCFNREMVE